MKRLENIIEVKNLSKQYKDQIAIDNISFTLKKKQTLGLLGPNGSGKSTTIGILLGLITASYGTILIDNIDITSKQV